MSLRLLGVLALFFSTVPMAGAQPEPVAVGNVYDSLGEAYMIAGERDRAIENYRRSLELDPANENAVEKLRELGASP